MQRDILLEKMRAVLQAELDYEKSLTSKPIRAEVTDVGDSIVGLRLPYARFDDGDVVGYLENGSKRSLGTVIGSSDNISVATKQRPPIKDGDIIDVIEAENLTGLELQIQLVDLLAQGAKIPAAAPFLRNEKYREVEHEQLYDQSDVKGRFELDRSQVDAVESILGLGKGEILLIIGPPGTGKTRVIGKAAKLLAERGERVLIASHTNRAVDNAIENLPVDIALRIGREEKVLENILPYLLGKKVQDAVGKELDDLDMWINHVHNDIDKLVKVRDAAFRNGFNRKGYAMKNLIMDKRNELMASHSRRDELVAEKSKEILSGAKIVGSTLVRAALPPMSAEEFDVVLVDESSQASITLALLGMLRGKRWVLIGDNKQLAPIFRAPANRRLQFEMSAFNLLLAKYPKRSLWLTSHYRSNPEIIRFSAEQVYGGKISAAEGTEGIGLGLPEVPRGNVLAVGPDTFVDVVGEEMGEGETGSVYNEGEVVAVEAIMRQLRSSGVAGARIGIITPYRAQARRLRDAIGDRDVHIDTVDSFQGREKDVIIISLVGTSSGSLKFVSDPNRLNVALTRARMKRLVVGNRQAILHALPADNILVKFVKHCEGKGAVYTGLSG